MVQQGFSAGVFLPASPPLSAIRAAMTLARLAGADSVFVEDHFEEFYPTSLWDRDFSWLAPHVTDPHAIFDYQTLLGALARHAGRMQVGIGVTESVAPPGAHRPGRAHARPPDQAPADPRPRLR